MCSCLCSFLGKIRLPITGPTTETQLKELNDVNTANFDDNNSNNIILYNRASNNNSNNFQELSNTFQIWSHTFVSHQRYYTLISYSNLKLLKELLVLYNHLVTFIQNNINNNNSNYKFQRMTINSSCNNISDNSNSNNSDNNINNSNNIEIQYNSVYIIS
jgi:hypothetical protein